jgi:HTH-type transcriptional regulator, SHP2-responsive activator
MKSRLFLLTEGNRMTEYFGQAFGEFRLEKNLTLTDFESIGISTSSLAKFERGETSMGFERVVSALEKMKVSLREFELRSSYQYRLIHEIEGAVIDRDEQVLQRISKQTGLQGERLLYLTVQTILGKLDENGRDELSELLRELEHWGYVELSVLLYTIDELRTNAASFIIEQAVKRVTRSKECQERMLQVVYHSIASFCSRGAKEHMKELFAKAEVLEKQVGENLHLKVLRLLIDGYREECFGNKSVGIKLERQALSYLEDLGASRLSAYYQLYHHRWSGGWIGRS